MRVSGRQFLIGALLASVAAPQFALAQEAAPEAPAPAADDGYGDEIIVTAQKRAESLQDVPISIQALGERKLDDLNVTNFQQYAKLLPSVAFLSTQPGVTTVYFRGVAASANGAEGNHSGPLPTVGSYLDEQPITTIGGTLDVHVYDVARIESLSGPQGTLYGASSEAGTIRIITNKPDTSGYYGRVDAEANTVDHGDFGGKLEGMINAPLSSWAALRVVGFYQRDAGFIDNVPGTRSYLPTPGGITIDNAPFVEKDYNDSEVYGGRAALKIDLDSNWTVTPSVLYQDERTHGSYAYDPQVGDLKVQRFFPEYRRDRFIQAALTIEGKVGNWDVTYAGAYLDRKDFQSSDYTDYAEAYDSLYASVGGLAGYFYYQDNAGNTIDPRQNVIGTDHFKKLSQEFRVSSPQDDRFRVVAGLFYQRQSNLIHQDYKIAGLADDLSVNGFPGTLWLTQQHRVDKDYAMFGELAYDILPNLTLTAGARAFIYDNSLIGFFGFGRNPDYFQDADDNPAPNGAGSSRTGVAQCFTTDGLRLRDAQQAGITDSVLLPAAVGGSPCTNLATYAQGEGLRPVRAQGQGVTHKINLTWKPTDDLLLYATWSRGFRPGGINRRVDVPPYAADYLVNYELGAKATLFGALHVNTAIYQQEWRKFQFSFLGANSFTEVHNGPNARIRGIEADASYTTGPLSLATSGSYTDAKTRQNLCLFDDPTLTCADTGNGNIVSAPSGTRLPITPRFKINGSARYTVPVGDAKAYGQLVVAHQSSASADIRTAIYETFSGNIINPAAQLGRLASYTTGDAAIGVDFSSYNIELYVQNLWDERAELSRFSECGSCGQRPYIVVATPRTIGIRLGAKF